MHDATAWVIGGAAVIGTIGGMIWVALEFVGILPPPAPRPVETHIQFVLPHCHRADDVVDCTFRRRIDSK